MLSVLVQVIVLLIVILVVVYVAVTKSCSHVSPIPPAGLADADIEKVADFINSLNIITNLLIAVPGIMLLVMGFPVEGGLVVLCSIFSCLWHATGYRSFAVLDTVFAVLAMLAVALAFLRVMQVRGYPEFTAFYLTLPLAALLFFVVGGHSHTAKESTLFITDRISHIIWHTLVAASFFLVALEVSRVPSLLPNRRLADAIRVKNLRMQSHDHPNRQPWASLGIGFFASLR
jgi:hypothetical protein